MDSLQIRIDRAERALAHNPELHGAAAWLASVKPLAEITPEAAEAVETVEAEDDDS